MTFTDGGMTHRPTSRTESPSPPSWRPCSRRSTPSSAASRSGRCTARTRGSGPVDPQGTPDGREAHPGERLRHEPLTLIGIAIGLAMDAFAVSIAVGLSLKEVSLRQTLRLAYHFGLFQALMPIIGWLAGRSVERWIGPIDHWIAFGLLASDRRQDDLRGAQGGRRRTSRRTDPTKGASLVVLSVATSIDALAVGLSLALLGVEIWHPALVIGLVALVFTAVGLHLGKRFGALLGRRMEIVGGVILIAIGVRILVEHLFQ